MPEGLPEGPNNAPAKNPPIAQWVGIAMLAWAILPINPYGYYVLLRIVICGISAYLAYLAVENKKSLWAWGLGLTAVVYNPIIRVHFSREIWTALNVATIILFVATIWSLGSRPLSNGR